MNRRRGVRRLEAEAAAAGIAADDVPRALGRPASSLPKMIDEYYWVTITRGHVPPTVEDVERWHTWAMHSAEAGTGDAR